MIVTMNSFELLVLNTIRSFPAPIALAKLRLFKNDFVPGRGSTLDSFVSADFTGYAQSGSILWKAAGLTDAGIPRTLGDQKIFTAGTPLLVPNTVYGWYVVNSGGTDVLFAERFAVPVLVVHAGQNLAIVPELSLSSLP